MFFAMINSKFTCMCYKINLIFTALFCFYLFYSEVSHILFYS